MNSCRFQFQSSYHIMWNAQKGQKKILQNLRSIFWLKNHEMRWYFSTLVKKTMNSKNKTKLIKNNKYKSVPRGNNYIRANYQKPSKRIKWTSKKLLESHLSSQVILAMNFSNKQPRGRKLQAILEINIQRRACKALLTTFLVTPIPNYSLTKKIRW